MKVTEIEVKTFVKIQDAGIIPVDIEIEEKEFTKDDGETFTAFVTTLEDQEVRVPKTVIAQLQAQLKENPDLLAFKVTSSGSGMNTAYTVIPK